MSYKKQALNLNPLSIGGFSPTDSQYANYAIWGGGGALAGAGIGALINKLREKNVLEGLLYGAGIGGASGLGLKGLADIFAGEAQRFKREFRHSFRERAEQMDAANKAENQANKEISTRLEKWWNSKLPLSDVFRYNPRATNNLEKYLEGEAQLNKLPIWTAILMNSEYEKGNKILEEQTKPVD